MFPSKSPKPWRMVTGTSAALLVVFLASGCGDTYPADMNYGVRTDPIVLGKPTGVAKSFGVPGQWPYLLPEFKEENGTLLDPSEFSADHRAALDKPLVALFGTPAAPKVTRVGALEQSELDALLIPPGSSETIDAVLAEGSYLYRINCLHCHGLTGDGHGPTAAWVNPHPRDYRPGVFKFTSSSQSEGTRKPRREDLLRVLRQGIEGTSMPSFGLLEEKKQQALASYVIHLSLRGQCEINAMREWSAELKAGALPPDIPDELKQKVEKNLVAIVRYWLGAEKRLIKPTTTPKVVPGLARTPEEKTELEASIRSGYKRFLGVEGTAACGGCHKDFGRGQNLLYDAWGTVVRPADLTTGIYRGGRRPIDLFWRIHTGINGGGMPDFPGRDSPDGEKNMWDIINFVLTLPYPDKLPPEIRDEIYPAYKKSSQTAQRD